MSVYRRKDATFNARLAVRHDELRHVTVVNGQGQVVISALPYLTFPTQVSAEQFLRRVTRTRGVK